MIHLIAAAVMAAINGSSGLPPPAGGIVQCSTGTFAWIEAGSACHSDPKARTVESYCWTNGCSTNPCWYGSLPCASAAFIVPSGSDDAAVEIVRPDGVPPGMLGVPVIYCRKDNAIWAELGTYCHRSPQERKAPYCGVLEKDGSRPATLSASDGHGGTIYYSDPRTSGASCRIPKGFALTW